MSCRSLRSTEDSRARAVVFAALPRAKTVGFARFFSGPSRATFPPHAIRFGFATAIAFVFFLAPSRIEAIPYFAHEFGLRCQTCHTVVPHLTEFGEAFEAHGFSLPGLRPQRRFPVAVKINTAYSSEHDPTGLPKATLDEVELFVAGTIGKRANFFIEQYAIDGGRPGATRDAWVGYRLTPASARIPIALQAGQFTLPLPVDPESFRETLAHYAIYDQRVGANPFAFFDAKMGGEVRVGAPARGTSVAFLALGGHDAGSQISARGIDTMIAAQHVLGAVTLSAYRYAGKRPLPGGIDRFSRLGYGVAYRAGPLELASVLQTGFDGYAGASESAIASSGGFAQLRYAFTSRTFAVVRYEGTNDRENGFERQLVPLVGYRLTSNSRLTIEDVLTHDPTAKHALGVQFTVAY